MNEQNKERLYITSYKLGQNTIHKKLEASTMGLYDIHIRAIESYIIMSCILVNLNKFGLWHDRLGHPGATMTRRIIMNMKEHPLKNIKVLLYKDYFYETCSQGKFITRSSMIKVDYEFPSFLQRI